MDKPNPIPLCPALLAAKATIAIPLEDGRWFEYQDLTAAHGIACLGSMCAKWVPQINIGNGPEPHTEGYARGSGTGLGWCADNLRRAPFADPAGGAE